MNLMMVESQENPKPSAKVRPAPRPPAIARRSPSRSIPPAAMFFLLRLRPGRPRRAAGNRPARRRGGDSGKVRGFFCRCVFDFFWWDWECGVRFVFVFFCLQLWGGGID